MLRWRDYMPTALAYTVQSMNIPEDPYEDPIPFDTGLDFWGGFKDQPGFDLDQWQLCMYNIKPDETLFDSDLMQMFQQDLVRGHPDRRSPTRQALIARATTSPVKDNTPNAAPEAIEDSRRSQRGPITLTGMEPIPQSSSVDDELDTLLTEMTKKTYAALAAADMDSQVWDQLDQLMKADAGAHAQLQYFIRTKKVIPPVFQPPPGTEDDVTAVGAIKQYRDEHKISEIEEKTKEIARKMKAAGAKAVANSMAQGGIDPREDEAAKAAAALRAAASKKKQMKHKSKRAAAAAKPKKREKTAESSALRRRKSHLPDSDEDDAHSTGLATDTEDQRVEGQQEQADEEGDDADNDLDMDEQPPPRPPSQPVPVIQEPPPQLAPEKKPRHVPPPPPRLPTPPPATVEPTPPPAQPPAPAEPEPPAPPAEPPAPPAPAPSLPKKVALPAIPTRPTAPPPAKKPALTSRLLTPKKPAAPPPTKSPTFKARPPPSTLKTPPSPPKRTPIAPEAPTPRPPSRLLKPPKEEDVVVWNILRQNNQQQPKRDTLHHPTGQPQERRQHRAIKAKELRMAHHINRTRVSSDPSHPGAGIRHVLPGEAEPKLGKVTALSWFPGLDGQEVTVTNVAHVLGDLVRGIHRRKTQASAANMLAARIEATKMLAYVYRVFGRDIRDPMATVILPLVETMHGDPEWMIRAQIAAIVPRLGLYHPDLISGLVARLADTEEQVRKAAMNALAFFGITTSETLSAAMVKLGLLPQGWTAQGFKSIQKKYRSILDAMYDEYMKRQEEERQASVGKVNEWLKGTQMRYTERLAADD
ncbi:hypothetical protein BCR44DRAFT_80923 [Catenaria anguillulae PL171]|uniref:Uncharacterized protein n=1 Tax=Catenaria anguillulae PL171 TaxID=765915 RepID=A0A1Y2HBY4_9FUNG|nr:hypothetical protein BCR44DRAFT_80923 [Catenaria anguillulae PL171]